MRKREAEVLRPKDLLMSHFEEVSDVLVDNNIQSSNALPFAT
jgi:hypothetical protein